MYHANKITPNTLETAIESMKKSREEKWWTKNREKNYLKLVELKNQLRARKLTIKL